MIRSTSPARAAALAGGVLALTLVLAACGDDSTTGSGASATSGPATSSPSQTPASGPFNDADIAFATGMIPHHGQAVAMAELAPTRAGSPEVKELAEAIKAAQGPEIEQMSGWLAGWGAPVPDPSSMAAGMGHDMGDMGDTGDDVSSGMAGMMGSADMAALERASGVEFDRLWLTGMVAHHRGAIAMADAELAQGVNPDAEELAREIVAAQQSEITTMVELLAG